MPQQIRKMMPQQIRNLDHGALASSFDIALARSFDHNARGLKKKTRNQNQNLRLLPNFQISTKIFIYLQSLHNFQHIIIFNNPQFSTPSTIMSGTIPFVTQEEDAPTMAWLGFTE